MNTTVLTFGHIPKFHGGRQQSGLANAMWAIASNIADRDSHFKVIFCATDIKSKSIRIGGLPVMGWTKVLLLSAALRSPIRSVGLIVRLAVPCRKYGLPLVRTSLKALHLQHTIAQTAPNFLHLHGCESVAFLEAGLTDPAKTFVTVHGVHGIMGPQNLSNMEEALNRVPIRFLAFVSRKNAKEWRELYGPPAAKTATIPNAFDRTEFFLEKGVSKLKRGVKYTYRLVSVGAINENKGQRRVIEAIVRLKAEGASHCVDYTMIGNGNSELVMDLLGQATAAGIRVRHLPYLSPADLRAQLSKADFMILPAYNEGFGLVFLESIACGVPVVLPKNLPICDEPGLISKNNAVLIDNASDDAVYNFLVELPLHKFYSSDVASSLPKKTWQDVGARYRALLMSPA